MNLEQLADTVLGAAAQSGVIPELRCAYLKKGEEDCFEREEKRELTPEEKTVFYSTRPFHSFNPDRLCPNCKVFYFLQRGAEEIAAIQLAAIVKGEKSGGAPAS